MGRLWGGAERVGFSLLWRPPIAANDYCPQINLVENHDANHNANKKYMLQKDELQDVAQEIYTTPPYAIESIFLL